MTRFVEGEWIRTEWIQAIPRFGLSGAEDRGRPRQDRHFSGWRQLAMGKH
jgi:hypothetical protein